MSTMPIYKVADMLARYNQAYQVLFDDPVSGRNQMVHLFKEMDSISPRELAADGNKLENIRVKALHGILEALSAAGEHQSALEWLNAYGWHGRASATDSIGIMRKAYCHYNLGDGRAAGELIRSLIDDEAEPSFMDLPNRFFTLVQYQQFELAHEWLAARRGQPAPYPGWATPKGISLLYRLEAELLLEEGHAERAMVAFDKSSGDNSKTNSHPGGLYEAMVIGGRPNLALRLLKKTASTQDDDTLWMAIAQRAQGRTAEAHDLFVGLAEAPSPYDEFLMLNWVLANCYASRIDDALIATVEKSIDEGSDFETVSYYTLGLVLALAGRVNEAQVALARARLDARRHFRGHSLDRQRLYHCTELLDAAKLAAVKPFFDPHLMPDRFL